jgi:hypothetical protein
VHAEQLRDHALFQQALHLLALTPGGCKASGGDGFGSMRRRPLTFLKALFYRETVTKRGSRCDSGTVVPL